MKYCRHCGAEMFNEAVICVKCGCPDTPTVNIVEDEGPKLTKLALLGFIFSLVAATLSIFIFAEVAELYVFGIPFGVAGLVCSIIGLVKTVKNKQRGKGFAIAGIVVGAVVCALWLIIFCIAFYYIALVLLLLLLIAAI